MIIIVFGLPGSGKSYFASRLAKMIHANYANSDQLRKEIFPKREYSEEEKRLVYEKMLEKMKTAVDKHQNLVLDATFHKKDMRKIFLNEIKEDSKLQFIEVWAEEAIIRERLKKERPYSEADFSVYKLISRQFEALEKPHLTLESTNENINEMLQKASDYLRIQNDN